MSSATLNGVQVAVKVHRLGLLLGLGLQLGLGLCHRARVRAGIRSEGRTPDQGEGLG